MRWPRARRIGLRREHRAIRSEQLLAAKFLADSAANAMAAPRHSNGYGLELAIREAFSWKPWKNGEKSNLTAASAAVSAKSLASARIFWSHALTQHHPLLRKNRNS